MIASLAEQVVIEMKGHPFTMIAVLALIGYGVFTSLTHASNSNVTDIESKIDRVLILQLGESIRNLARQVCVAEGENKRILQQTVEDLQQDYIEIAGQRYPVVPCPG